MVKVSFVLPALEWSEVVEDTIRQDLVESRIHEDFLDFTYSVNTIHHTDSLLPSRIADSDVIVSRGLLYDEVHQILPHIPMVEIPIGNEITMVALQAVRNHGLLPIAVIGSYGMCFYGMGITGVIPGATVRCYRQDTRAPANTSRRIDQAIDEGARIIICGPNTRKAAELRGGCHAYTPPMTVESARYALARAKVRALQRSHERMKAAQFQTLLSVSEDGIITIDDSGLITAFNQGAENLLGVPATLAINTPVASVLTGKLDSDFLSGMSTRRTVIDWNGQAISVTKTGIVMGQQIKGHVVTLKPSILQTK